MGKALVVSGGPNGLYTVKLLLHRARVEKRLTQLAEEIAAVDPVKLAQAQAALDEAQAALDQAIVAQDLAIISEDREGMTAAAVTVAQRAGDRDKARLAFNALTLRLASLRQEQATLTTAMPADPEVSAWCADYSEDLAGEVATLEIPGERKNGAVLIRPGHNGQAAFTAARDGQLQPTIASTPAGTFFNWALLPGWQKWKPTYRLGTITALAGDTGTVVLDPATSSAQQLPVNQSETLTGVPITYMDCNAEAFEVGDRVVVAFDAQDWAQPRVIGFADNPRECRWSGIICKPVSDTEDAPTTVLQWKNDAWIDRRARLADAMAGSRREIFDLTNAERTAIGLVPFKLPPVNTIDPATLHAHNMAATGLYGHEDPGFPAGEQTIAERVNKNSAVTAYGENIARFGRGYNNGAGPTAAEVVQAWKDSPAHWANMSGFNGTSQQHRTHLYVGVSQDVNWFYFVQVMVTYTVTIHYGNLDWKGHYRDGVPTQVLSYQGPPERHRIPEVSTDPWQHTSTIYKGTRTFARVPYSFVRGAALLRIDEQLWIVAIAEDSNADTRTSYVIRRPAIASSSTAWYDAETAPEGWRLIGSWTPPTPNDSGTRSWFFNGDGTQAARVRGRAVTLNTSITLLTLNPEGTAISVTHQSMTPPKSNRSWSLLGVDWRDNLRVTVARGTVTDLLDYLSYPGRYYFREITRNELWCGTIEDIEFGTDHLYDSEQALDGSWRVDYTETAGIKRRILYADPRYDLLALVGVDAVITTTDNSTWPAAVSISWHFKARIHHGATVIEQIFQSRTEPHTYGTFGSTSTDWVPPPFFAAWLHNHGALGQTFYWQAGAGSDAEGRSLVSIGVPNNPDMTVLAGPDQTVYPVQTAYYLTQGDPATVIGIGGSNLRLYPVGAV